MKKLLSVILLSSTNRQAFYIRRHHAGASLRCFGPCWNVEKNIYRYIRNLVLKINPFMEAFLRRRLYRDNSLGIMSSFLHKNIF